jgi:hypothetical protein
VYRTPLIALAVLCVSAFTPQAIDRAVPPVETAGAGGFSAQRLPARVGIDGRAWTSVEVHTGQPEVLRPAGADYELRFSDADNSGDFERWAVTLQRPGNRPVSLTGERKTTFVYVTPDARYVFMEPLTVVDMKTWRRYSLDTALGIAPYVSIVALSRDGRLFIERSSCAMDCSRRTDEEYFELKIPSAD